VSQIYLPIPEFDLGALTRRAILTLQTYAPKDGRPYHGCFSGGKDSVVIKELARLAGVPIEWHYNVTTIDPPELVRFIRREHRDVAWSKPPHGNFFRRMVQKGFPTRRARWCCAEYKEKAPPAGAVLVLGVRAAESARRATTWKTITFHRETKAWAVAPILDWRDDHVWDFIHLRGLSYCGLYDEGFTRLGCIGCPMNRQAQKHEFARWPKFERNWRRAFRLLWERRTSEQPLQRDGREWMGSARFGWARPWSRSGMWLWEPETGWERMWDWWLNDDKLPPDQSQGACQLDMWSNA
jgi:phosphoadenosine phosphosulfate reductase